MNKLKLRWASKLMRAKFFVLLTDKTSIISLQGVDPKNFDDMIALSSQEAAIADFGEKLSELQQRHHLRVQEMLNKGRENKQRENKSPTKTRSKITKSPVKKISVKEDKGSKS